MKKHSIILCIVLATLLPGFVSAQCAMCRRTVETNQDANDNKVGRGLNHGILYLLALPYVIGSVGVFVWWKNRRKD
ncbi:MAG: hypothetical protein IT242_09790 [Bacteroidia bacterium]|nr:hypothetical protein [Bacteroidia bacterium]